MVHELKCVDPFYEDVAEGTKTFELRMNDREYNDGDQLLLKQYSQTTNSYSGFECKVDVIKVYKNMEQFGLPAHMCIMAIKLVTEKVPDKETDFDEDDEGYF